MSAWPITSPTACNAPAQIHRDELRREILAQGISRLVASGERAAQAIAMARIDRHRARDVPALFAHFRQNRLLESGEAVLRQAGNP